MKKLWQNIKYFMGWFPKFESHSEMVEYIKRGDIETLCLITKQFKHLSSHDYKDPQKEVQECFETYTADCYGKMWIVKLALDNWEIYNKRISLKAEYGLGHSALYFHHGQDFGIISNGNIYIMNIKNTDDGFNNKVISLMERETGGIYSKVRVYY